MPQKVHTVCITIRYKNMEPYTRVYEKVSGLALLTKKYITYLGLNTISFEMVTLRSNAPVTVFLSLLESFCVSP
jgi:hypothetical protein